MAAITFRITGDPASFKSAMGEVSASLDKAGIKIDGVSSKLSGFKTNISGIGTSLSLGLTLPALAMGKAVVDASATFDTLQRALLSTTGNAKEAAAQFERLQVIAKLPGIGLEEAVRGSIRLQNYGLSAALSEKALRNFSNAVAAGGGTAEDTAESLRQLGQMYGRGKVTMDNLRIILERVPQSAAIIRKEFGSEALADPAKAFERLGLNSAQVIETLIDKLGDLAKVQPGIRTGLENLSQEINKSAARIGDKLTPSILELLPKLEKLASGVADAVDGFTKLPPEARNIELAIGAVAIAAGPTIKAIQGLQVALVSMRVVAGGAGLALGSLFGGVVIAGIVQMMSAIDKLNERYRDLAKAREFFAGGKADPVSGLMESGRDIGKVAIDTKALAAELDLFGVAAAAAAPKAQALADANKNAGDQAQWHTAHAKALTKVTAESEILHRLTAEAVSAHARQIDKVTDVVRSYGVASLDSAIAAARLADEQFRLNRALEAAPDISTRLPFKDIPKAQMPTFPGDPGAYKGTGENIGPEGMLTKEQARAIEERYKRTGKAGTEATRQVSLVMNDLAKGITDVIFKGGKMGDMFKNVAMAAAQSMTRYIIEEGIKKIAGELLGLEKTATSVFGKIFGSGASGTSGIFSNNSSGGAGGSGATGKISGSASSVASAAGGALSIIGAIADVATAVSSIFGNLQMAAINKTLDLIEKEARFSQIHLLNTLNKANEYWPYMKSVWESLVRMEQRSMAVAGGSGMTFDFRGATFGANFDQDAFAKNLIKTLKNNGF